MPGPLWAKKNEQSRDITSNIEQSIEFMKPFVTKPSWPTRTHYAAMATYLANQRELLESDRAFPDLGARFHTVPASCIALE